MRDWRTTMGALLIVAAMVLGAFAGIAYMRSGGVGASLDTGTRGEDRRLLSAFDEIQKGLNAEEAQEMAMGTPDGPVSLLEQNPTEFVSPDGAVAKPVSAEEQRTAAQQRAHAFESSEGRVTVKPSDSGTRSHLSGGEIDAGGPYGGPDVVEGSPLTVTVSVFDPSIIFFRYDFDGDGIFDYPEQTSGTTIGDWTTQTVVEQLFLDDFFGEMVVQGWDGVSTDIEFNLGDNLAEPDNFQWFIGYGGWNFAWRFRAKSDLTVTELGHYHYVYAVFDQGLWDSSGNLLGTCEPVHSDFTWNWCTLPSPVNLVLGEEYLISIRISEWMTAIDTPSDTDRVQFQGTYYCYSPDFLCYPDSFWVDFFIPNVDFRWEEVLIVPDAAQDTAFIEVNNVAPTVSDVMSNPNPGLEGTPTELTASFDDPGLADTWEYRWTFHDGEVSEWRPVSKFDGGARVLMLHSWTGDAEGFRTDIVDVCGNFCVSVDLFDFGPLGQNRVPRLDELLQYDVLLVGTNWGPIPSPDGMGDRLAEFMDAAGETGGGIVMMFAGFTNNNIWGIGGRWETDGYTPLDRSGFAFFDASLGTIYSLHPILDGVSDMNSLFRHDVFDVTDGAERIADFTDGRVLAAVKENPMVPNGARAVGLPWYPWLSGGDFWRLVVNSIQWSSRQADPVLKTMPIQLDPFQKVYADDEPTTTTPEDTFSATVEVRDDDHNRLKIVSEDALAFENFDDPTSCYWFGFIWSWPAGWYADPDYGWRCGDSEFFFGSRGAVIWYYYNDPNYGTGDGTSNLYSYSFDLSAYTGVRIEYNTWWQGDYPFGTSDGFLEASVDGGASWIELQSFHHNDPASYEGPVVLETTVVGGYSDVVYRFRYESSDDWWWYVDDVQITGLVGEPILGLGVTDGFVTVANVAPTVIGGFDNALRDEAQSLTFKGFEITDPAIVEPTEWFAYAWDFDDGSPVSWEYKGTLAPPRSDILVIHTLCLSGSGCPEFRALEDTLNALDVSGTIDTHNFINYPNLPTAPTLSTMLQYDVIIVATNWAYFSYAPFDLARRQVGDRLASYIDAGRGGVLTFMAVYDLSSFFGDIFSINGRYMEDDYGPFEKTEYLFGGSVLGTVYDPEHDLFVKVDPSNVESALIHSGDMRVTTGGRNAAAGVSGVLLADWSDGNSAVGVKELNNGQRTAHLGLFGMITGQDTGMLIRNSIGWVAGGIPSPKITPFTHTFGDNGIYNVDLVTIDDDMGFVWDFSLNEPVPVMDGPEISHRFVEVAVENVEPTILPGSVEAFIAAQFCIRVTGTSGNTVSLDVLTDGTLSSSASVTRVGGDPNPPTESCAMLKVDVLAAHDYEAVLAYDAPMGGSNPTWLVIAPWRQPVTPGHGTVTIKYDFETPTTVSEPLPTLKSDLFAAGDGALIDFVVEAFDAGTDDLAFVWSWGGEADAVYDPGSPTAVYSIHVHHNDGSSPTDGVLDSLDLLGFSEAYFDRDANSERTPTGATDLTVRDSAVHAFPGGQGLYFVFLMVVDDDNGRGYPTDHLRDGMDVEVIVLDLR